MATAMAGDTAAMVGQDQQQQQQQGPIFVDTQHDDMVHDAQLDYYGCKLATSSSGKLKCFSDVFQTIKIELQPYFSQTYTLSYIVILMC